MSRTPEQRLDDIETALAALLSDGVGSDDAARAPDHHCTWTCDGCNYLLGVYDTETDVFRRTFKGDVIYITLGDGGHISVICRRCAQPNKLDRETIDSMNERLGAERAKALASDR